MTTSQLIHQYLQTNTIKKIPQSKLKKHNIPTFKQHYYLQNKSKSSTTTTSPTKIQYS